MKPSQLKLINRVVSKIKELVADNDPELVRYLNWVENNLNDQQKHVVKHFIRSDIQEFKAPISL